MVFDDFCLSPEVSLLFKWMILPENGWTFLEKYGEVIFPYAQMDIVRVSLRVLRGKGVKLQSLCLLREGKSSVYWFELISNLVLLQAKEFLFRIASDID